MMTNTELDAEIRAALKAAGHGEDGIMPKSDRAIARHFYRLAAERCAAACHGLAWKCCEHPVVGAEYMGQQEMICCGELIESDAAPTAYAAACRAIGEGK